MRSKQLFACCSVALLLLMASCKKGDAPIPKHPSNLIYTPDTAFALKGKADTSVTPIIDWNGKKGKFSFVAAVPQGITIDETTGKISWPSSLPIGTYILPVVAGAIAGSDTSSYTLTVSGMITTIAGGSTMGFSGDGGEAVNARLNMPFDVTVDAQNNIYIADGGNNRIRKISPDGSINTIFGNGIPTFDGDGGPASRAALNSPTGIFIDDKHNFYITDFANNRIRKVGQDGIINTVAGKENVTAWEVDDEGPATQGQLYLLGGKVSLDPEGSLYIPDYGDQRVRKVTPDGIIHTVVGTGGSKLPIPDGTPASGTALGGPCGVYYDAARSSLFIVSNTIGTVFRLTDGKLYSVAGNPQGWGSQGEGGDGQPAIDASFHQPTNIVGDPLGNLYIADFANNKIRRISPDGLITTVAGSGRSGFSGDGGPAAAASLSLPYGLIIDANGDLIIADTYNNRIRKVMLH